MRAALGTFGREAESCFYVRAWRRAAPTYVGRITTTAENYEAALRARARKIRKTEKKPINDAAERLIFRIDFRRPRNKDWHRSKKQND